MYVTKSVFQIIAVLKIDDIYVNFIFFNILYFTDIKYYSHINVQLSMNIVKI